MAKRKGNEINIKNMEKDNTQLTSTSEPSSAAPPIERCIEITIKAIENIIRKHNMLLTVSIQHKDLILGESDVIDILPNSQDPPPAYDINYTVQFPITVNKRSSIDAVLSVPILIKVTERLNDNAEVHSPISEQNVPKIKTRNKSAAKNSQPTNETKLTGICSLDVMPLLLGEKCVTEKLIMEIPKMSYSGAAVSWPNLPMLIVTMKHDKEIDFFPQDMQANFLTITLESIYNPLPSFTDDYEFRGGTIAYIDSEVPDDVIFKDGRWTKVCDFERNKRWQELHFLENRAKNSKQKLNCDAKGTKNEFKTVFDLKKKMEEHAPRIEWNYMSRHIILHIGNRLMQEHINKYKYWPFVFMMTPKHFGGSQPKSKDTSQLQLYQCYIDVTELLYPGRTRTRVVTQLYTYNPSSMLKKTGIERDIFGLNAGKELKEKDKKEKGNIKERPMSAALSVIQEAETPSVPLTTEAGDPVVVLIELELYTPLIQSRVKIDFTNALEEMITKTKVQDPYPYTIQLAEEQYLNSIGKLVDTITEGYRDFIGKNNTSQNQVDGSVMESVNETENENSSSSKIFSEKSKSTQPESLNVFGSDELSRFIRYLYETGLYVAIQSTLKKKMIFLLDQKFKSKMHILHSKEGQDFVATAYIYLTEQMHLAINKEVEGHVINKQHLDSTNLINYCYYAEEADELNHIDDAKRYHRTAIANDKTNPDAWIMYATYLIKIKDNNRAIECCREAIVLDKRHKIALLLYGILLWTKGENQEAEIFLKSVTSLYPRFTEGWMILHLFYIRTEYYPGVDLTIQVAEKCLNDKDRDTVNVKYLTLEPLAWSMIHCPKDQIYIITAVLLLKMNLCDFAGIALAQELAISGRSTPFLYYMAVHHYLLGRYDDALSHLKEAQCQHGMDYSIGSLMGHCHYKEGNLEDAMYCYEFVNMIFDSPDDMHLVHLRMGQYCLDTEQNTDAIKYFLNSSKFLPTPQSWLGAGVTYYCSTQFEKSEMALMEANKLDSRNCDIWGYLCLLNMSLQRHDEFQQCYRQAVKNNLKNVKLWLMITRSMEFLGYSAPMLAATSKINSVEEFSKSGADVNESVGVIGNEDDKDNET